MTINWRLYSFSAFAISLLSFAFLSTSPLKDPMHITALIFIALIINGVVLHFFAARPPAPGKSTTLATKQASTSFATDTCFTLYIGNLPYKANEEDVRAFCQTFVNVQSVRLMKDKCTGKRKGYGFLEVSCQEVEQAIEALNEKQFNDRTIKVRAAKEKPEVA